MYGVSAVRGSEGGAVRCKGCMVMPNRPYGGTQEGCTVVGKVCGVAKRRLYGGDKKVFRWCRGTVSLCGDIPENQINRDATVEVNNDKILDLLDPERLQ